MYDVDCAVGVCGFFHRKIMGFDDFVDHVCSLRITEWFGLERALKIIAFQSPCHGQGRLLLDQA